MALRFRKTIRIAPGIRINIGKKSASASFGAKGFHHTISTTGKKTTSVGIPGTGISYRKTDDIVQESEEKQQKASPSKGIVITILVVVVILLVVLL